MFQKNRTPTDTPKIKQEKNNTKNTRKKCNNNVIIMKFKESVKKTQKSNKNVI